MPIIEFAKGKAFDWPNCVTPDCGYLVCDWGPRPHLCFPCSVRIVGIEVMVAAYDRTHDHTWEEEN